MTEKFSILTVCTGNICRSPLADQLLRAEVADLPVVVSSAGTHARDGDAMQPQAIELSHRHGGIGAEQHEARWLTEKYLRDADLVLAMSREHRKHIVSLVPAANRYTFTLREFARLSENLTDAEIAAAIHLPGASVRQRLRETVELVALQRGQVARAENPEDDDIIDPYRRSQAVYEQTADELVPAVGVVSRVLHSAARGA